MNLGEVSTTPTMNTVLFEDTLDIRQLNVDGKKFERVNRLHCKSNDYDVDVVLGELNRD